MICAEDFGFVENTMREADIILPSCTQVLRSTASVATRKNPGQLVCNKYMIMKVAIDMSWSEALRKEEKP